MIHTSHKRTSPFEIIEVLEEAGADLSHVAFAHLERTLYEDKDLLDLAGKGCYIEFDLFGIECSHSQVRRFKVSLKSMYIEVLISKV